MANEITELLNRYHANTLRDIARANGIETKKPGGKNLSKRELVNLLKEQLFTCERVAQALKKLNRRERTALDYILLHGGGVATVVLSRKLVHIGMAEETPVPTYGVYAADPKRAKSKVFADVIARLTMFGLVFSETTSSLDYSLKQTFTPGAYLFIPPAIRDCFPQPEQRAPEIPEPPIVKTTDPYPMLRDLYFYWDYVRRNSPKLLKNGNVNKRALKAINEQLIYAIEDFSEVRGESDDAAAYLRYLRHTLTNLNLVHTDGQNLRATTSGEIPDFWMMPPAAQLARIFGDEIAAADNAYIYLGSNTVRIDIHAAHQKVLDAMRKFPVGKWISLERFWAQLQAKTPNFLISFREELERSGGRRRSYYNGIALKGRYLYGTLGELLADCDIVEFSYLSGFIFGNLSNLGLVDVGWMEENGEPVAFRLTKLGYDILHGKIPDDQSKTGTVVLQPNFQILTMGPVSAAVLAKLDTFADRAQADVVTVEYHITRQSVYRAQQADVPTETIIQWLTEITGQPIPQNVLRSLQEWGAHHRRIVFRRDVNLLQAADPAMMDSLLNKPDVKQHIARALTPTIALLNPKTGKSLTKTLFRHDILPATGSTSPESVNNSIRIQPDGTIAFVHHAADLYLYGKLKRYAEKTAAGQWWLTPESVRRATGDKKSVLAALDDLQRLNYGKLPTQLVSKIKAWGNYYGNVAIDTLTLIEFRDADIMAELMRHPALQGVLSPLRGTTRALAVLSAEKLPQVEQILTELGISVRHGINRHS